MTLNKTQKNQISEVVSSALSEESFTEFLERFDITPEEAFIALYESGIIDPEDLERFLIEG